VALGLILVWVLFRFALLRLRGPLSLEQRALWVQASCRSILNVLGVRFSVQGQPPTHGLVVCNHLSYLDILILSAAMPCFFVAKMEIGAWPYFGRAARLGGTIFLDRSSLTSAMSVAEQISARFSLPIPVLLFPEGTSSDGSQLLRFHSRLIEPATSARVPVTAAAIRYGMDDGTLERELCWFGDQLFVNHLWKMLGLAGFYAEAYFGQPRLYTDRREAADATHDEITKMRAQSTGC
jgi:1-acyl-sn-glycerol-3-phosphate acyltransferase